MNPNSFRGIATSITLGVASIASGCTTTSHHTSSRVQSVTMDPSGIPAGTIILEQRVTPASGYVKYKTPDGKVCEVTVTPNKGTSTCK